MTADSDADLLVTMQLIVTMSKNIGFCFVFNLWIRRKELEHAGGQKIVVSSLLV